MKIQTNDLTGRALDWAVAVCEGGEFHMRTYKGHNPGNPFPTIQWPHDWQELSAYTPSTDWAQGGPIIEREEIFLAKSALGGWTASVFEQVEEQWRCTLYEGPTPLIAAMRCYVASELGNEIDVPDELLINDRKWHSGPPPHVGWWNASSGRHKRAWRWWNGEAWSISVFDTDSSESAAASTKGRGLYQELIEWTDYWPENARVPRIDPRSK